MKSILLLISLIFIPMYNTIAQTDAKAIKILDNVSAQSKKNGATQIELNFITAAKAIGMPAPQKWKILTFNNKFRMDMGDQVIYCDGKTIWRYLKADNEVEINDYVEDANTLSPTNIFSIYKKQFKAQYMKEEKNNNTLCDYIELYPLVPKKKNYSIIKLFINKAKQQMQEMQIKNKDGSTLTYSIQKIVPNVKVTDTDFIFDATKYPKVQINDLR